MHGAYAIPRVGYFYSRPCGRGDDHRPHQARKQQHFYSRPCGRGDLRGVIRNDRVALISTHAPAGGATSPYGIGFLGRRHISTHAPAGGATHLAGFGRSCQTFLLTPLREGRHGAQPLPQAAPLFLLTPLREGRRHSESCESSLWNYFYSRPCGRGDPVF